MKAPSISKLVTSCFFSLGLWTRFAAVSGVVRRQAAAQHIWFSTTAARSAEETNRSFDGKQLHKLTGFRRPYTSEEDAKLLALKEAGHNWKYITAQFPDRTWKSLEQHLRKARAERSGKDPKEEHRLRSRKRWTRAEALTFLRLIREEGLDFHDISVRLERSPRSCETYYHRFLNPKDKAKTRRMWSPSRDKQLVDMYEKGSSYKEIADAMGCTSQSAISRLHTLVTHGVINLKRNRWTDEEMRLLLDAVKIGKTTPEIPGRTKLACRLKLNAIRRRLQNTAQQGSEE